MKKEKQMERGRLGGSNKKWIDGNEKEKSERGRLGGLNIEQNVASGKSFQT